jgi:hypothetical protein
VGTLKVLSTSISFEFVRFCVYLIFRSVRENSFIYAEHEFFFSGDNYLRSNFLAFQLLLDKVFINMVGKDPSTYKDVQVLHILMCLTHLIYFTRKQPVIVHQKINTHFNLYCNFFCLMVFCPSDSLCEIN